MKARKLKKFLKIVRTGNWSYFTNRLFGKPYLIQFVPNISCNLNCVMCHQKDIRLCANEHETLNFKEIRNMFKNLKKLGVNQINLVGGEIFLRPDIWDILDELERQSFLFSITTNGTLLKEEDVNRFSYYWGLVEVDVSLDAADALTHDKIRGVSGAFDKTVEVLSWLKEHNITVMVDTVAQSSNYCKLKELYELLKKLKIDSWVILPEYNITKFTYDKTNEYFEARVKHKIDLLPSYSIAESNSAMSYDVIDFKEKMSELRSFVSKDGPDVVFAFDIDFFEFKYFRRQRDKFVLTCTDFLGQIDWKGNLNLCPFIRVNDLQRAHGLVEKDFLEQPELLRMREGILASNLIDTRFCETCCGCKIVNKNE